MSAKRNRVRLHLLAGPTEPVITLDEAKLHCRVDGGDEDGRITALIAAATVWLDGRDGFLGRCLKPQSWQAIADRFPCRAVELPLPPTIAVEAIAYFDPAGTLQTLAASTYRVVEGGFRGATIVPRPDLSWPATACELDAVRITFRAGYEAVPEPLRQAMLLMIGDWYENRGNVVVGATVAPLPIAAETLLSAYRIATVA